MRLIVACLLAFVCATCSALYSSSDAAVELTEANFKSKVLDSDQVWIVEFYAPWCGHCKTLAPEFKKAALALKGVANLGHVDMTQHQSVGAPYNVKGFPTLKVFAADKAKPSDYNGARTASAMVEAALAEVKKMVNARLGGGGGSKSGGDSKKAGNDADVFVLTDANFEATVIKSTDMWLVEFYAPWCGHCKTLEPHWKSAATELKGKVKLGKLDATEHKLMAEKFGVRGFPTIKMFASGQKTFSDVAEYDGGRTSNDIVTWCLGKVAENVPAPEIHELINQAAFDAACEDKPLCVISILPHLLDCQAKCRKAHLAMLATVGDKFKKNLWGYGWAQAMSQPEIEEALGIGGFGYPAMAIVNARKGKFSILKGSFTLDGVTEFLRDISFGRGGTAPLGKRLAKIVDSPKWDGKDGEMPTMDDIDVDDVVLDKIEL
jgi:protein disulfide-isomerase A6